jgi:hypothetical protein
MKLKGIICVEGADGTGKTTLCDHLVKEHGAKYLHAVYRFKDKIPAYHYALMRKALEIRRSGGLAVLDRLWLTEAIYASVFRGGTQWPQYTNDMDDLMRAEGILTVVCMPLSIKKTLDRKLERDQDDAENAAQEKKVNAGKSYSEEQMLELYQRYNDFWHGSMFYEPTDRAGLITRYGGAQARAGFAQYRIELEGLDVPSFIRSVARRMDDPNILADPKPYVPWREKYARRKEKDAFPILGS